MWLVLVNSQIVASFELEEDALNSFNEHVLRLSKELKDNLRDAIIEEEVIGERRVCYIRSRSLGYLYNGQTKLNHIVGISHIEIPPKPHVEIVRQVKNASTQTDKEKVEVKDMGFEGASGSGYILDMSPFWDDFSLMGLCMGLKNMKK